MDPLSPTSLLIIEDSAQNLHRLQSTLESASLKISIRHIESESSLREALQAPFCEAVIAGYDLEQFPGLRALEIVRDKYPALPFIYVSAALTHERGAQAMAAGASDYLLPNDLERLPPVLVRELERAEMCRRATQNESLSRDILNNSQDAIITVDNDFRIIVFNRGAEEIFGYRADEILGQSLNRLLPERYRRQHDDHMRGFTHHDSDSLNLKDRVGELFGLHKDGHEFPAEISVSRSASGNGGMTFTAILRDLTRRHYLENMSRLVQQRLERTVAERTAELELARNEAEQLAAAKSEFLSNMSHEIRTPMNAVLGLTHLLETQDLSDEARNLTHKIQLAGKHLLNLINDILDFSKMESERLELEHKPFELDEVLENLSVIMASNARDKALELVISPPPDFRYRLHGDAHRLGQVLINLTGNAIKFTEQGSVELRIEEMTRAARGSSLRFSIKDTGIGISAEEQARLFRPFAQADASVSRRFGGSGLGLIISRRLVEMMGGELQLASVPGEGSTFWFELQFDTSPQPVGAVSQAENINIMIVDDNPIAREGASATAASLGWQTLQADSCKQAMTRLQQEESLQGPHNVVLLDWRLRDGDGLTIAREIYDTLPEKQRPLLFLFTAQARSKLDDHPDLSCVESVLDKPLCPSTLYNAVNSAFTRRRGVEEPAADDKGLAGLTLLVVDDSEANREVAKGIFSVAGARVHTANNGQQALDWLHSHPQRVDIVLMDVQMPVMDGYQATREIRRSDRLASIPIVALSAGALIEQEQKALEAGMDAFLPKPFDVPQALALLRRLAGLDDDATQQSAETLVASGANDLPGLAVSRGLKLWADADKYRAYLRKFAAENSAAVQLIADSSPLQGARLAHKIKGAAGNLALQRVAANAGDLERVLQLDEDPGQALENLQQALDEALPSIAAYATEQSEVSTTKQPPGKALDQNQLAQQLSEVRAALANFDTTRVETVVGALAPQLGSMEPFSRLQQAVEDFDANAGQTALTELTEQLNIQLEH